MDITRIACYCVMYLLFPIPILFSGTPIIESFIGSKTGSDIILLCSASGTPAPTVTFTSQGQTVTSALQGHSINSNTLRISEGNVRQKYSCIAKNRHGTVVSTLSGKI